MQERGAACEIDSNMRAKFGVQFDIMEKVHVNGPDTHEVYKWLRLTGDDGGYIGWNFAMFLVSPTGTQVERFPASQTPLATKPEIDASLGGSGQ